MSKKFDAEEYISRWDDRLIPIMLVVIVALMVGAYALNVFTRPACTTHDYVFCGTALDEPSEAGHHQAATEHSLPAGGESHEGQGGHEGQEGQEGHPH